MKRSLLVLLIYIFAISFSWSQPAMSLPATSEREALSFPWFPSKMHAFIWRNWTLVPAERMAQLLHTGTREVNAVARSMGLSRQSAIDTLWLSSKGYITVLRRNWHLLPYEQLTELIRMSASELAWRLIDDDYLYIKLGSLKPQCAPLRYHEPTAAENVQARQIARWLRELAPYEVKEAPRFRFFETSEVVDRPSGRSSNDAPLLNIAFSYCSEFGDPLLDVHLSSWPDNLLSQLAARGINGLWIHTSLASLVPSAALFPGSDLWQERLNNLQRLVDRAARYGIRIFLYANEPRATQKAFFEHAERQSLGGVVEGDLRAFCTSDARTLQWLRESYRRVFRTVKGLGGVFTITASENLTSCASHWHNTQCPRCAQRSAADIIREVNNTIVEGVKEGDPTAETIVWDWAWTTEVAESVIPRLDKRCRFMSVSEWSLPLNRGGVETSVGEYSISAVGPGPRARHHWDLARRNGIPVMAKIQVNTSWELGSVTSLPAMNLIATHARRLAREQMSGIMYCWSLGGYPSLNMSAFAQILADTTRTLRDVAVAHYGENVSEMVSEAWKAFSQGMEEYPYHVSVLYNGPQHSAPANPFYLEPTGWRATMVGIPYDDLNAWRGPYSADIFVNQMRRVADGFRKGIPFLEEARARASKEQSALLQADARRAQAVELIFQSVANQADFTHHRNQLLSDSLNVGVHLRAMRQCVTQELDMVRRMMAIVQTDPTMGYESSNQYFYIPQDLREKYVNLCYVAQQLSAPSQQYRYVKNREGIDILAGDVTVAQLRVPDVKGFTHSEKIEAVDSSTFKVSCTFKAQEDVDDARLQVQLLHPSTARFWMIPSVSYNGNAWGRGHEPKGAQDDGQWRTVSYRRTPISGAMYSEGTQYSVATWSTAPRDVRDGYAVSIRPEASGTAHCYIWPEEELPTNYCSRDRFEPGYRNAQHVHRGEKLTMVVYVNIAPNEGGHDSMHAFLKQAWKQVEKPVPHVFGPEKLWELGVRYAKESLWAEEKAYKGFSIGLTLAQDGTWQQRGVAKYEIGWCGQNASYAITLLQDYLRTGSRESLEKGIATLDTWSKCALPNGLFVVNYDNILNDRKSGTIDACNLGVAALNFFEAYDVAKQCGYDRPEYERLAYAICDFVLRDQQANGCYARGWKPDGECVYREGTVGCFVVPAMIEAYRRSHDAAYLTSAQKAYDHYLAALKTDGYTTAGALDTWCIDKESSIPLLRAAMRFYQITKDKKYIDDAIAVSYYLSTWLWHYDEVYPADDNFTVYGYHTFGATSVSVQHNHLDPYALYWVPEWLELSDITGDAQWREKALAIWRNGNQLVSDGTLNINGHVRPAGAQNEAYFECQWGFSVKDKNFNRINDWLVAWPGAFRLETLRRLPGKWDILK